MLRLYAYISVFIGVAAQVVEFFGIKLGGTPPDVWQGLLLVTVGLLALVVDEDIRRRRPDEANDHR